jgi:hypothetical protein
MLRNEINKNNASHFEIFKFVATNYMVVICAWVRKVFFLIAHIGRTQSSMALGLP